MKTILSPVDFSKASDAALKHAARLALALDARIVLFTVVQPIVLVDYAPLIENITELSEAGQKHATQKLEKLAVRLRAQSIPVETAQALGAPVAHILRQAEACSADYIVMGSHGHTAFYDLLVGSTAHGVLHRARCPVLIVPSAKAKPRRK